ncbi:MAG: PEP-CTERM sorting domain-containing protein [Armatimonadetes bacterium]|nr:PEP-CTERM sorting domain-containing protein [Armatimonadota bacterium]
MWASPVTEPASMLGLALGAILLARTRRKRQA